MKHLIIIALTLGAGTMRAVTMDVTVRGQQTQITFDKEKFLQPGFFGSDEGVLSSGEKVQIQCGTGGFRGPMDGSGSVIGAFQIEGLKGICIISKTQQSGQVKVPVAMVAQEVTFDDTDFSKSGQFIRGSAEGTLSSGLPVRVTCGTGGVMTVGGAIDPTIAYFDYKGTRCFVYPK